MITVNTDLYYVKSIGLFGKKYNRENLAVYRCSILLTKREKNCIISMSVFVEKAEKETLTDWNGIV